MKYFETFENVKMFSLLRCISTVTSAVLCRFWIKALLLICEIMS